MRRAPCGHGIFLCRVRSPNGPFGKRSLHKVVPLSRCSYLISYNLINRKDVNTDLEMLTSMKVGLHFGVISVKFSFNFNVNFV